MKRAVPVVELLVFLALMFAAYKFGARNGQLACQAAKVAPLVQSIETHNKKAARAQQVEKKTVAAVAHTDAVFDLIDAEVKKYAEKTAANDDCGLDDDGLRLWRAANAGAEPVGAGQPDGGVSSGVAAASQRQAGGPAGQPHNIRADLPQVPPVVPGAGRLDGGDQ